MKTAYFDCIAGASGDMILGALVDAGLSIDQLDTLLQALHLTDFKLVAKKVTKNAFGATKVDVIVADDVVERHLGDIVSIVENSALSPHIKEQAIAIFNRIGSVEASIHGTSLEHVHLHELGGVDTIVDVVGALVGLEALNITHVICSPIPLGRGFIHGAHGVIPLPAPATLALLKGVPVTGSPLEMETVTPTGAALLSSLADTFGPIPQLKVEQIGYGAGSKDLPIPNVLRVLIGTSSHAAEKKKAHVHQHHLDHSHTDHSHVHQHQHKHDTVRVSTEGHQQHHNLHPANAHKTNTHSASCLDAEHLVVLETNIDDLNPEFYAYVMDRLFEHGALDVFFTPIQMKKNRPATLLRVLCPPDLVSEMTKVLFRETSTLGIREHRIERHALPRTVHTINTTYGDIKVKVAAFEDGSVKSAPEYEDCRQLAKKHNVPIREVYQTAEQQAKAEFGG